MYNVLTAIDRPEAVAKASTLAIAFAGAGKFRVLTLNPPRRGFMPPSRLAPNSYMLRGKKANKTAIERAFDLAKSGSCLHFSDIIHHLKSEGNSIDQIEGGSLKRQLAELFEKAKKPHA